jgi:hypothetical protein
VPISFSVRAFEVATWGAGHRGLLLRSSLRGDHEPLIEIWFKPAYAVCLGSSLKGIHLTTPQDPDSRARVEHQIGRSLEDWERLYQVATKVGPPGWVVAGSVSGRQHHRVSEAGEPAMSWEPQEGVEQLFRFNVG